MLAAEEADHPRPCTRRNVKRCGHPRIVPFQITGHYGQTEVGIDWKRDLSRK